MEGLTFILSYLENESLYFQMFGISILGMLFFTLVALRHRKSRTNTSEIPAPLVKVYLEKYIEDSMSLHEELFGDGKKFKAAKTFSEGVATAGEGVVGGVDPELVAAKDSEIAALKAKLTQAEKKSTDLNAQIEKFKKEKAALEAKVASAGGGKAAAPAQTASSSSDVEVKKLQSELDAAKEKIKELEARLAEYDVIEDDLANLKKLQQENAQLKAQLKEMGGGGASAPAAAPAASIAAAVAAPTAAAAIAEPVMDASALAPEAAPEAEVVNISDVAAQKAAEAALAEAVAAPEAASPAEAPAGEKKKDDSELLDEFEKMLAQ